jgi:hypothetical protein
MRIEEELEIKHEELKKRQQVLLIDLLHWKKAAMGINQGTDNICQILNHLHDIHPFTAFTRNMDAHFTNDNER